LLDIHALKQMAAGRMDRESARSCRIICGRFGRKPNR
jgi:hypothetical protein